LIIYNEKIIPSIYAIWLLFIHVNGSLGLIYRHPMIVVEYTGIQGAKKGILKKN